MDRAERRRRGKSRNASGEPFLGTIELFTSIEMALLCVATPGLGHTISKWAAADPPPLCALCDFTFVPQHGAVPALWAICGPTEGLIAAICPGCCARLCGRDLCRNAILQYVSNDATENYAAKLSAVREELRQEIGRQLGEGAP